MPISALRQKDTDARWTKKRGQTFYGCKSHIAVDRETKLIEQWATTAASVHDSRMLVPLLAARPSGDPQLWADCAYCSQDMVQSLHQRGQKLNARQVVLNKPNFNIKCSKANRNGGGVKIQEALQSGTFGT